MKQWTGRAPLRAMLGGALVVWLAGCASSGSSDCTDGIDNDGDGLIDSNDPGCALNGDVEAPDPDFPACADSVDNDSDGLIDFPDDPGCISPEDDDEYNARQPECRDGIDNDDDGLIDYPNDPGCHISLENSEADDCPDGPECPECANGVDDDDDGLIDYGTGENNDPGCDRAADDNEFNADPGICGNVELLPLPSDGLATGSAEADSGNELISTTCGGSGSETVYTTTLDGPTALVITTDFPETTLDTVVYVRSACRDPETELGCDDDTEGSTSTLQVNADAGVYYIVVDAHNSGSAGDFKLGVTEYTPIGQPCDPGDSTCAPGLVCRPFDDSATQETCEYPRCSDGIDNDGDGLADVPDDPGCESEEDNDENDSCDDIPVGADCPQCGNGIDDDDDSLIDYAGGDPGCTQASDNNEIDECIAGVDVLPLDPTGVSGTTSGGSFFVGSCGYGSYPEDVYSFKVTQDLLSITFSTVGSSFDTVTYVRYEDCGNSTAEVACEDPGSGGEEVTIADPENGGTYFIFVDGSYASGDYVLEAYGEIAGGDACDPADTQFVCESGYYCDGGTNTCLGAACNNGVDDDSPADGLSDYPDDPGCTDISDNDESDDCDQCPSCTNCPECSDGVDNDSDGAIDYGSDPGCASAGDDIEDDCPGESDPVLVVTEATTSGSTTGLTNDFEPSCSSSTSGPEQVFVLSVPGKLSTLDVDTDGTTLDTVLYVKMSECSTPDLGCHDGIPDDAVSLTDLDPGSYLIFVDGYGGAAGNYVLNVHGVIRGGEHCNTDQIDAGIFECEAGYSCNGDTCAPAQCNDGINNDSDSVTDYPDDPGCDSISDDDESDDDCQSCPSCTNCPDCSDGEDNDGDGAIDYGTDPGCTAASDDNEIDECIPGVEVLLLTDAGDAGTTPPSSAGSNFTGSCHSSTLSTEVVYSYQLDAPLASLTFSTLGSTGDTVTYVRDAECGEETAEVGCENEDGGEEVTIDDPSNGWYFVFVDGDYVSEIDYVLNVYGTILGGESCEPGNTQFVCEAGYTCDDTSNTCAPSLCNNGEDDDSDGLVDSLDPGCADLDDQDEGDDTCVADPATCPACANGDDDDSDGFTDYPADSGCVNAADDDEVNCADSDPIELYDETPETGTTTGATNDFAPSCSSTSAAADVTYELRVPGDLVSLEVNTNDSSYDTVLMVRQELCTAGDLDCDDDDGEPGLQSLISLTDVPAGRYFLIVDGYSSNTGTYYLEVTGVIASGQPCDPDQIAAGFMSCEGTTACSDPGGGYVCN